MQCMTAYLSGRDFSVESHEIDVLLQFTKADTSRLATAVSDSMTLGALMLTVFDFDSHDIKELAFRIGHETFRGELHEDCSLSNLIAQTYGCALVEHVRIEVVHFSESDDDCASGSGSCSEIESEIESESELSTTLSVELLDSDPCGCGVGF